MHVCTGFVNGCYECHLTHGSPLIFDFTFDMVAVVPTQRASFRSLATLPSDGKVQDVS